MKLHHFTAGSAFILLITAAFFSVNGLIYLFSGAAVAVGIMATALEIAKVIVASFLNRRWKKINLIMKFYLSFAVFILMLITSIGIYGYLSNAYQKVSNLNEKIELKKELKMSSISLTEEKLSILNFRFKSISNRMKVLNDMRKIHEERVSRMTETFNNRRIAEARQDIISANEEIKEKEKEMKEILSEIETENNKIMKLKVENIENEKELANVDVGPLKYISKIMGISMDKVVFILILTLIFVFDPLAMILVIATNSMLKKDEETEDKKQKEKPKDEKTKRKYIHTKAYIEKKKILDAAKAKRKAEQDMDELNKKLDKVKKENNKKLAAAFQ